MSPITKGQRFNSLADFKTALRKWAIDSNFTPAILDSDSRRVRAGCRTSPNCPFRIRCNFNSKTEVAVVTTLENVHTCSSQSQPGAQGIKRAETCKLKFLLEVVPQLITVDRSTPTKAIIDAVKARYGQEIAMRQAQKVRAELLPKTPEACASCGAQGHSQGRCPSRHVPNADQHDDQDDTMEDDGPEMQPHIEHEVQVRPTPRVPHVPSPNTQSQARTSNPTFQQPTMARNNSHPERSRPPIDPGLLNRVNTYRMQPSPPAPQPVTQPAVQPVVQQPASGQTSMISVSPPQQEPTQSSQQVQQQQAVATREQPSQPTTDVRMEAARMMHRASQLMQEAARLNAEAAKLIASG